MEGSSPENLKTKLPNPNLNQTYTTNANTKKTWPKLTNSITIVNKMRFVHISKMFGSFTVLQVYIQGIPYW